MSFLDNIEVPAHIENPIAYRRGIARNIERGRQKKMALKLVEWLAANPSRIALTERLAKEAGKSEFFSSLNNALTQWGGLTEKQEAAARAAFTRKDEFAVLRTIENMEIAARSNYVGKAGSRCEFKLSLVKQHYVSSYNFWVNVLEDPDGNQVTFAGTKLDWTPGTFYDVAAFVKGHEEREGIRQTKINRIKASEKRASIDDFLANRFSGDGI